MDLLSQQVFEARVQLNVVFAQVAEQLVCPQDLGNSHQLEGTTHTTNCVSFWYTNKSLSRDGWFYILFSIFRRIASMWIVLLVSLVPDQPAFVQGSSCAERQRPLPVATADTWELGSTDYTR